LVGVNSKIESQAGGIDAVKNNILGVGAVNIQIENSRPDSADIIRV
jgi:hypothetical protein